MPALTNNNETSARFEFPSLGGCEEVFAERGYVVVGAVMSKHEVERLRKAIARVSVRASELPEGLVWFSPSRRTGHVIQRISRINQYSRMVARTGRSHPRLLRIASQILGCSRVCAADGSEGSDGSVLVIKHPDNASEHRELRWHQDAQFTEHLPINPFINLGIYLDDCSTDEGQLVVLPGSHRLSNFDQGLKETTLFHPNEIDVQAASGDIVIHSSQLWHRSRAHCRPGRQRRVLYFNYYGR